MVAFAIDSMLPSLPEISADLQLANTNHAQLIIIVFVLGSGLGQLVTGPLSDTFGRKTVISIGICVFFLASLWAFLATSFVSMLLARFVQGIAISAPRTVTQAMVRDTHSGRGMARIMSFAMMLFVLVPAVAPYIGQTIMLEFGWRYIFVAFQIVAVIALTWLIIRQPETHPREKRTRFRLSAIVAAAVEVFSNRHVITCTISLSLGFTCIFAYLVSAQQAFVVWLGVGHDFPLYFALISVIAGSAGFLNAILVVRLGMWRLSTIGFIAIFIMSVVTAIVIFLDVVPQRNLVWMFVAWSSGMFFLLGLCLANLNALGMEPMGHIAGMASSIIGAVSTLTCVILAVPIGQMFDGTGLPLICGVATCAGAAFLTNLTMKRPEHTSSRKRSGR